MPIGIRIFNTSGSVQIDQHYRNLALASASSVTTVPAYSGASYSTAVVTLSGALLTLGLRSSVACCVEYVDRSGGDWIFYIRAASASPAVVYYYAFDVIASMPTTPGLRVWDASGNPVFHSSLKYMRVVDAIRGKSPTHYGDRVYDPTRTYAWVTSVSPLYSTTVGGMVETRVTGASSYAGGIRLGKILLSATPGSGGAEAFEFSGLVLDVTNF